MKLITILFFFLSILSFSQDKFVINDARKTVIPFQLINNLIFIPLSINGVELTFLLDSGVNETILFSLDNKEINFNNTVKVKFSGLGETKNIEGLQSDNNIVSIGNDFKSYEHRVYIILDQSINFSSHLGISVHGIIGYQFFKDHPVEIDYISKKITVYNDGAYFNKKRKRFTEFPITIEGNKPYIIAGVEMTDKKIDSKMLLDLGNSDAVWLFPKLIPDFVYNRPNIEDYLGQGFNGDIFGKRSRIHRLYIGNFQFNKPLTALPDEYSIQNVKIVANRKGSVGSDVMRRFRIIFDYAGNRIFLRKNKHYGDPFLFNKSGLDIQHNGVSWQKDLVRIETTKNATPVEGAKTFETSDTFKYNFVLKPQYSVTSCRKDSPCSVAGIQKNDKIISINDKNAGEFTLEKINDLLKSDDGTILTFEIERKNQKMKFQLTLIDPIPYQDAH